MAQVDEKPVDDKSYDEVKKKLIGKAILKETDMDLEQANDIMDKVISGIEGSMAPAYNAENACKITKEQLDKQYGPCWHVIIGEYFSYDITKQQKSFLFMFYNGNLACLIYKT